MRRAIAGVLFCAAATAALAFSPRPAATPRPSRLPFYDAADLSPRWPPVAHRIAPFTLTSQRGARVTGRDLDGRIHVASFFFTRCPSVCPLLVERLQPVQEALADWPDVVLVSYSMTPGTDTPEVLADFGRIRGIDPARWLLLTGDRATIASLAHDSYFADDARAPAGSLLHTEKLLLVDRHGRLRGVYDGSQRREIENLLQDVAVLRAGTE